MGEGRNTTFFRQQDTRIGRWLSVDPKTREFESPYAMIGNNPIMWHDMMGDTIRTPNAILNQAVTELRTESPKFNKMLNILDREDDFTVDFDPTITGNTLGAYESRSGNIKMQQIAGGLVAEYKATLVEEFIHKFQGIEYQFDKHKARERGIRVVGLINGIKNNPLLEPGMKPQLIEMLRKGNVEVTNFQVNSVSFLETEAKVARRIIHADAVSNVGVANVAWSVNKNSEGGGNSIFNYYMANQNPPTLITAATDIGLFYRAQLGFQRDNRNNGGDLSYQSGAKEIEPKVLNKVQGL